MINLLPYQEKKVIEKVRILRVLNVTLVVLIFLLISAGILLMPTLVTINSRYDLAQDQIAILEKEGVVKSAVDVASLEARTADLVEKLAAPPATPPIEYILTVRTLTGAQITLSSFRFDDTAETPTLSVEGVARSREALQSYVSALEAREEVELVDSPITNYVKSTDAEFMIDVVFKK